MRINIASMTLIDDHQEECNFFFKYKKEIFTYYYFYNASKAIVTHYKTGYKIPLQIQINDLESVKNDKMVAKLAFDFLETIDTEKFYNATRDKTIPQINAIEDLEKNGIIIHDILDFLKEDYKDNDIL